MKKKHLIQHPLTIKTYDIRMPTHNFFNTVLGVSATRCKIVSIYR